MIEPKIRILIADDHAVVRKGLVMVLRLEPDFEIVAEADNGRQALELAQQLKPDLVLMDLVMPEMDGEQTMLALRAILPQIRVLILSGVELDDRVLDLLAAGIDGYVMKDVEPGELTTAIRTVAKGEAYIHPALARRVLERTAVLRRTPAAPPSHLTPRQQEDLR